MTGEAQRIYQLIIDAGGSKAGAEMFKRAADQISDSAAKAVAAGKPLVDNVAAAEKAYRSLVTRIDPVTTAQTRMAREIGVVQQAFAAQKITVEQAATNLQQITTRYEAAIDRARRFGQGLGGAGSGARGFGAAIQQAGFQVGDFAVQVASGGGVLRPLIQQGTQLVSMFGPWGAVIGAAGAALGALATALIHTEDATKKAKEATKQYTDAMEAAEKITKDLHGTSEASVPALQAERRERLRLADAVLAEAQAKITAAEASVQAARTNQILNPSSPEDFGVLGDPVVNALDNLEKIKAAQAEIILQQRKLKAENQFGGEDMDPFAKKGQDFSGDYYKPSPAPEASTFSDNLLRAFNEHAEQARQTVRTVQTEGQKVETVLDGLKKQYDDLTKAPVEVRAENLFAGKIPTQEELQRAEEWLKKIDAFKASQAADKQNFQEINQIIEQGTRGAEQRQKWAQTSLENQNSEIELLKLQLELSDESDAAQQTKLAHLKAEQEVHQQLGTTMDANAQRYIANADAIAKMSQQLQKQKAIAAELPQFFDQAFDRIGSAITEAMAQGKMSMASLLDVGRSIASELAQEFLKLSLMNPLKNLLFGSALPTIMDFGGGWLASLFGSSAYNGVYGGQYGIGNIGPSGQFGHAAKGGYIEVGEEGPERFYPGVSGTIYPTGTAPYPSAATNSNRTLVQIVDQRGANAPAIEEQRSQTADGAEIVRYVIREVDQSIRTGKLRRSISETFGASGVAQVQRG